MLTRRVSEGLTTVQQGVTATPSLTLRVGMVRMRRYRVLAVDDSPSCDGAPTSDLSRIPQATLRNSKNWTFLFALRSLLNRDSLPSHPILSVRASVKV
jgi:hypothetical protein